MDVTGPRSSPAHAGPSHSSAVEQPLQIPSLRSRGDPPSSLLGIDCDGVGGGFTGSTGTWSRASAAGTVWRPGRVARPAPGTRTGAARRSFPARGGSEQDFSARDLHVLFGRFKGRITAQDGPGSGFLGSWAGEERSPRALVKRRRSPVCGTRFAFLDVECRDRPEAAPASPSSAAAPLGAGGRREFAHRTPSMGVSCNGGNAL
jgi:hypothetical protein